MEATKTLSVIANPVPTRVGSIDHIKRNWLYEVEKIQLGQVENDKGFYELPISFGNYKIGGGPCLGVVGGSYEILQPIEFVESIEAAINAVENDLLMPNNARFRTFRNGSVISIKIPLITVRHKTALKSEAQVGDTTDFYLDLRTSFDGKTATTFTIYSERLVCGNGMVSSFKETEAKFKHTPKGNERVKQYAKGIETILNGLKPYQDFMEKLTQVEISEEQQNDLLEEITGYRRITDQEELDGMHVRRKQTYDALMASIDLEIGRTGQTAFGLLQGITHYTNHSSIGSNVVSDVDGVVTSYNKNEEYITLETGNATNNKAQNVLRKFLAEMNIEQGELV